MRLLVVIIFVLCMSANLAFANEYENKLIFTNGKERITEVRISEAKLLESYVVSYREKINTIYANYSQEKSIALENANFQMNTMIETLNTIQYESVSETSAVTVMKKIVEDIKVLNIRMKKYLESESILATERIQKEITRYKGVGKKINIIIDSFIVNMTGTLVNKKNLSYNEREIVRSLVRIRDENNRLKNSQNRFFSSLEEIKDYYQSIIENIRKEIRIIKSLAR